VCSLSVEGPRREGPSLGLQAVRRPRHRRGERHHRLWPPDLHRHTQRCRDGACGDGLQHRNRRPHRAGRRIGVGVCTPRDAHFPARLDDGLGHCHSQGLYEYFPRRHDGHRLVSGRHLGARSRLPHLRRHGRRRRHRHRRLQPRRHVRRPSHAGQLLDPPGESGTGADGGSRCPLAPAPALRARRLQTAPLDSPNPFPMYSFRSRPRTRRRTVRAHMRISASTVVSPGA